VLLAGGKKYEQWINIKPNEAKNFTTKNIDKLYHQSMRLYLLEEKLGVLVDTLDNSINTLNKINTKTVAQQSTLAALDSMRKEILELNRKTIFFDEFKYRRRLSDVYMAVATGLDPLPPSKEAAIDLLEKELADFNNRFYSILNRK
jgi:hypothetical protein